MKFENFEIRLLQPNEGEAFFNLIKNNRSRLEDFFVGTVSKAGGRSGGISKAVFGVLLITVRSESFFSPNIEHPAKITDNRIKLRDW